MKPFFSVIIPLYNKAHYIETTLNSVLNQTFKDFEVIVIDDGSTDASLNHAKSIRDKRIAIYTQENKGLTFTRNRGISMAKGCVIALLDADDFWENTYLKSIHELYHNFPEAALYGTDYHEKYDAQNILEPKKNISTEYRGQQFIIEDFFKANLFQLIITQSNFAFKKEVFKQVKYDEKIDYAEDIDFYIACCLKYKFAYYYKQLATVRLDIPKQMTDIGFKDKRLPDFDKYEAIAKDHSSLKKFLDYNRYFILIQSRITEDKKNDDLMRKKLDLNNLTIKQLILLNSPLFILKKIRAIKKVFLKYNIRMTTF